MILINLMIIILLIGISFAFLYLGFLIFKKKPVLVSSNVIITIVGITFLAIVVGILSRVAVSLARNWSSLLFVPIYGVIFFFIKRSLGNLILFNVEEQILYRSITESLRINRLTFERWQNKFTVPSIDTEILVKNHNQLNTAIIYFNLNENRNEDKNNEEDLLSEISSVLKQTLSKRTFNKFPLMGLSSTIIGIFVLLISIWMAIATISRLLSGT